MKISMRSFPGVQIFIVSISFLALLATLCHSAERPSSKDLKVCSVYARTLVDLYAVQNEFTQAISDQSREIIEAKGDLDKVKEIVNETTSQDKLNKIRIIIKKYEDRIYSTCPGIGYKCETYLSRPERNVCKPFTIKTRDRSVFENTTYE